jgi:gamma-tubulin complex component 2
LCEERDPEIREEKQQSAGSLSHPTLNNHNRLNTMSSSSAAAIRAAMDARLRHQQASARAAASSRDKVSNDDNARNSLTNYSARTSTSASSNISDTTNLNMEEIRKEIDSVADRSASWSTAAEAQPSISLPPRPRRLVDAATKVANTPAPIANSDSSSQHHAYSSTHLQHAPPVTSAVTTQRNLTTPLRGAAAPLSAPVAYATPNAAYAALPNRDDGDTTVHTTYNNSGEDDHSLEEAKTPSTLMRSIKRSISNDRSEMAKKNLFHVNTGNQRELDVNNVRVDEENTTFRGGDLTNNFEEQTDIQQNHHENDADTEYEEVPNDTFHKREFNSHSLQYGSHVIIRYPTSTALTSLAVQPKDDKTIIDGTAKLTEKRVCLIANETNGCFGSDENRFVLLSGRSSGEEEDETSPYLCYGDVVTLRSTLSDRVLGIQKMEVLDEERGENTVTVKVGCFRRYGKFPHADRWVVLRGGADAGLVELGPDLPHDDQGNVPVYSGDSIVLRNDFTGGILSLGDVIETLPHVLPGPDVIGWSLNLITSSYEMHDGVASTEDDVELIEFLHRHNQCKPGKNETFQIVTADVPSCPDWVYPIDERSDRCFLDGSYLSNPNRHDLSLELQGEMWGDADDIPPLENSGESQRLAWLPVDVQETILLEEVIGAMMGLEGQFIRYHLGDLADSNDEEQEAIQPGFVIADHAYTGGKVDTTLEDIVSRILPLCSNYVSVNKYVQSCLCNYECGIMARALCEAISKLLQEHLDFVNSLDQQLRQGNEDGKPLSMTMVHARTRHAHRTMSTLHDVVYAIQGKKGGDLLNSLQRLSKYQYSGNAKCNEILTHLLSVCAVHYSHMLKSWMNDGRLHDPYNEFMIEVTNRKFQSNTVAIREGIEFENWCRVNDINVFATLDSSSEFTAPASTPFGVDRHRSTFHMSTLDKVHTTGKYRRAIHFCADGLPVLARSETETTPEEDARILLNPLNLSRSIDISYHNASDALLKMMLEKYDLMDSLQLMKRYFLLDQGDFFVEFLDIADEQLARGASAVSRGQVQNAIETSIGRTSDYSLQTSSSDPRRVSNLPHSSQLASALRCGFKKHSLVEELDDLHRQSMSKSSKSKTRQKELTGFEALQLEFKRVPFPTSLVLSNSQMRIYQILFRQIFFSKYVERQLVNLWSDHQLMKQMSSLKDMRKTFCLRRRMIHFIQNFVYYIKFEVIEPNWRELESKMTAAKQHCANPQASPQASGSFPRTVDDLLAEHNQFLINVINQCLLTNSDLIRASTKIMTTCLLFTTQMKLFMSTTKIDDHHETTRAECTKMRHSGLTKQKIDNARKSLFREQRQERTQRCADRITREVCTDNFQHMIARFDNVFSTHLSEFMKALKYDFGKKSNGHYTNLFMQLDYNGFVSSSAERASKAINSVA